MAASRSTARLDWIGAADLPEHEEAAAQPGAAIAQRALRDERTVECSRSRAEIVEQPPVRLPLQPAVLAGHSIIREPDRQDATGAVDAALAATQPDLVDAIEIMAGRGQLERARSGHEHEPCVGPRVRVRSFLRRPRPRYRVHLDEYRPGDTAPSHAVPGGREALEWLAGLPAPAGAEPS